MANIDNANGFRFVRSLTGGTAAPSIETALLAASQTIAVGDAIIVNASGLVEIAVATSGAILGVSISTITSSTASDPIQFIPALPHYVFEGQCSGTLTQALLFTTVDIEGATGVMEINENASTEQVVHLGKVVSAGSNVIGASARVEFTFARSQFTGVLAALT